MSEEPIDDPLEGIARSSDAPTRTLWACAPSPAQLAEKVNVLIGEYVEPGDQVSVSHSCQQVGWETTQPKRRGEQPHTTVTLEYSALVVLNPHAGANGDCPA